MKKALFLSITLCLIVLHTLYAQPPRGNGGGRNMANMPSIGKISGIIIDSLSGKPVEFATISIYRMRNDSLVSGAITNTKGRFLVEELKPGPKKVKIEFIGYQAKVVDRVMLGREGFEKDLGKIYLSPSATNLSSIEVTADKPFMQTSIDKKVFNVDRALTSEGGTANEILETIPSVDVDIDGAISLRGSSNVTILIDGRPSGLTGSSRAAILEQIPSSSIEAIEVITNPSAKFNPEGMTGIINIVLKKNRKKGISGNVTAGVGTTPEYNASAGLNYRSSKFNFFSNYGHNYQQRDGLSTNLRKTILKDPFETDSIYFLDQLGVYERKFTSNMVRIGTDLFLTPKNTLSFSGNINHRRFKSPRTNQYYDLDAQQNPSDLSLRHGDTKGFAFNYEVNSTYVAKFKKPKQELTVDLNYSAGDDENEELNYEREYFADGTAYNDVIDRQNTLQNTNNSITTIKADYVHPMEKKAKIETGYQTLLRMNNKDFYSETYDPYKSAFVADDSLNNEFLYKEQIHSVYGTFGQQLKKYSFQFGLRLEQVFTDSELKTTGEKFENNYFSFFPTFHGSRKIDKKQELSLSYSRRVNRPSFRSLNPFASNSDNQTRRVGNPFLRPEYIHSVEAGYNYRLKNASIFAEAFYKHTDDVISRVRDYDGEVYTSTFYNLAKADAYGVELILNYEPFKWWNINGSFNLYHFMLRGNYGETDLTTNALGNSGKLTNTFKPWKGAEIQLLTRYRGRRNINQGHINPYFTMDAAFKQKLFNNKATLSLRFRDVFDTREFSFFTSDLQNPDVQFEQDGFRKRTSQVLSVSFTYLFGKQERMGKRRRGERGGSGGDDVDF